MLAETFFCLKDQVPTDPGDLTYLSGRLVWDQVTGLERMVETEFRVQRDQENASWFMRRVWQVGPDGRWEVGDFPDIAPWVGPTRVTLYGLVRARFSVPELDDESAKAWRKLFSSSLALSSWNQDRLRPHIRLFSGAAQATNQGLEIVLLVLLKLKGFVGGDIYLENVGDAMHVGCLLSLLG